MDRRSIFMRHLPKLTPGRYLLLGFAIVIILGACCLMLPIAQAPGVAVRWTDAFFTSTSAVCVTGLTVGVTATHWSLFGQCVILVLIEIGGLGFMSFTTMFMIIAGRRITLRERLRIQESMNQTILSGGIRLIRKVFLTSLMIQGIGAVLLMFRFVPEFGFSRGVYYGIFHAISAFCNAGFDLIGDSSLVPYAGDAYVIIIIASLIIMGGLGYFIWSDIYRLIRLRKEKKYNLRRLIRSLTLQSKLVLLITGILLAFGWITFLLVEWENTMTLGSYSAGDKILISFFQSVTLRTAGYFTVSQGGMTDVSKFISCLLMFIGAASGGTAGGVKVATVGVLLLTVLSEIAGKEQPCVFERQIGSAVIRKAMAIFGISFSIVILFTLTMSVIEAFDFLDILYETVSALSTTGLSTGITPSLHTASHWILILAMYMGRTGSLTLAAALQRKKDQNTNSIHYPEESIMIG